MMCVLMRVRDGDALARACDLGLAMQLTNIARDVGEDARAGRLYLPLDWLDAEGVDPEAFLADPPPDPAHRAGWSRRLLAEAERLYRRSEAGVAALPLDCRPGHLCRAAHLCRHRRGRARATAMTASRRRARTGRAAENRLAGDVGRPDGGEPCPAAPGASCTPHPAPEVAFLVACRGARPGRAGPGRRAAVGAWPSLRRATGGAASAWRRAHCRGAEPALHAASVKEPRMDYGLFFIYLAACGAAAATGALFPPRRLVSGAEKAQLDPARLAVPGGVDDALPLMSLAAMRVAHVGRPARPGAGVLVGADRVQHALDAGLLRAEADAGGAGRGVGAVAGGGGDLVAFFARIDWWRGCCSCPIWSGSPSPGR